MISYNLIKLLNIFNNTLEGKIDDGSIKILQDWTLLKDGKYLYPHEHQFKLCPRNTALYGIIWR